MSSVRTTGFGAVAPRAPRTRPARSARSTRGAFGLALLLAGCAAPPSTTFSAHRVRYERHAQEESAENAAAAARALADEQAATRETGGIQADGRIPKVPLPADVPHPERWRYIPEGRMPEGDIVDRFMTSTFAVPFVFFRGDVGAGGGFSLTDIDFRGQRRREFATFLASYTTEGQQRYSVLWRRWTNQLDVPSGGVVQEERSFVQAFAGYSKTLTRRFYGKGPDTLESDESSFTDEVLAAELVSRSSLPGPGDDWVVSTGVRVETRTLDRGFVSGVPDTRTAFPAVFARDEEVDSLWISGGIRYDTRDSQSNPYRGWTIGANASIAPLMSDDRDGAVFSADARAFFPLPGIFHDSSNPEYETEENPPTDVLGMTFQVADTTGDLPFWALPSLGGASRLRGYVENRFTDDALWFAAIEHRIVVVPRGFSLYEDKRIERVGLALFYELGGVGPALDRIDASDTVSSYGASLRFSLERAANFRLDVGFSDEGSNLSFLYGLSF